MKRNFNNRLEMENFDMNTYFCPTTLILLAGIATSGCASSTNKALDAKIEQEAPVANRQGLKDEATRLIENDKDLSYDQKKQLSILRTQLSAQLDDISGQSLKLRSVLVEEVLSPNYSLGEVSLIKRRMKNLEDKRLTLIFDGVDKANSILGRKAQQHSRVMRDLLESRDTRE
jgi:hypothetical protein